MSAPQTGTPRTDDEIFIASDPGAYVPDFEYVTADFARTLERELSEAKKKIAELEIIAVAGAGTVKDWLETEKQNDRLRDIAERMGKILKHVLRGFLVGVSTRAEMEKLLSELDAMKGEK